MSETNEGGQNIGLTFVMSAEPHSTVLETLDELSVQDRCILWGSRVVVVVPKAGRVKVLDEFYEGHPGVSRMKNLARQKGVGVVAGNRETY